FVIYHVCYDETDRFVTVPYSRCAQCGLELRDDQIAQGGQKCPACGSRQFVPAMNPDGSPRQEQKAQGCGITTALSPLEIAFPFQRPRWKDVDFLIRLRWRTKRY